MSITDVKTCKGINVVSATVHLGMDTGKHKQDQPTPSNDKTFKQALVISIATLPQVQAPQPALSANSKNVEAVLQSLFNQLTYKVNHER